MAYSYFEDKLLDNLDEVVLGKTSGNILKLALVKTLDEYFILINENEELYYKINREVFEAHGYEIDNYGQAYQLGLSTLSRFIGSGMLAQRYKDLATEDWCSYYANLVTNSYKQALLDKFELFINAYPVGNEFNSSSKGDGYLDLSHLETRYEKEFGL